MVKNFLIVLNNVQQIQLKLHQKKSFKKEQKQLVIQLEIKLLIELQVSKNSETVTIEHDTKIRKERYISPEES